jgi:predicted nucleic acid-binding protein
MKPIFVDTSALIAIGNRQDAFHSQATEINEKLKRSKRRYVTTNGILLELGNSFSQIQLRPTAIQMIEAIGQSRKWNCVNIDSDLMNKGFQLFLEVENG